MSIQWRSVAGEILCFIFGAVVACLLGVIFTDSWAISMVGGCIAYEALRWLRELF